MPESLLQAIQRRVLLCDGATGTLIVVPPAFLRIMRWLPRWRTFRNPCALSIRQTSSPDRGRTLANRDLDLSNKNLRVQPAVDFRCIGRLEKQGQGFD